VPVSVPRVPGVPAVVFGPVSDLFSTLLSRDAGGLFSGAPAARWGIYRGGSVVVQAETVLSVDYRQEWTISDFPLERGAFESYNKVQVPYDARVRFAAGGTEDNRQRLLTSIAAIAGDLNLYSVVTPEATYPRVNVTHYDYARAAQNGLGLLVVDVWLQEIRVGSDGGVGSTASPYSSGQLNGGPVQPEVATDAQAAATDAIRDHSAGGLAAE